MSEIIDHQAREDIAVMRSQSKDLNTRFKEHLDTEEAMAEKMDKRSEAMEKDIAELNKRSLERQVQEKSRIQGYKDERKATEVAADQRSRRTNMWMGLATVVIAAVALLPPLMEAFK